MVLRDLLAMAADLATGLPVAWASSRAVQSFLFRTKPHDPAVMMLAATVLLAAAALAGYFPAWRATFVLRVLPPRLRVNSSGNAP